MKRRMKVYFAGPDVFELNAAALGKQYALYAEKRRLEGLYPLDNVVDLSKPSADKEIYQLNKAMIDHADYVVANLNDFRGFEPDSGTVWELAYAFGIGKKVIGYIATNQSILARIQAEQETGAYEHGALCQEGKIIEDFGNPLNLMLMHSMDRLVIGDVQNALDAVVEMRDQTGE